MTAPTPAPTTPTTELTPASTGRWLVRTQASAYELDLDARTALRHAGQGSTPDLVPVSSLRRDDQPVPLLEVSSCQVGRRLVLLLDVRGDGVVTQRVSTTVTGIDPLT